MGNPVQALGGLSAFVYRTVSAEPTGERRRRDVDPNYTGCVSADPHAFLDAVANDAAPAAKPDDEDQGDDGRPRIRWSKYDPRSRELARLRTDAKHRAKAAKTPEQRAAAIVERDQAKSEASKRQAVLRRLFYRDDVIDFVKGELVVIFDNVGQCKWRSEFLQAPDYILTFTK
jgi:hypothetical protein